MPRAVLTEAREAVSASPVEGRAGRFQLELITPGWGSSGYYSAEVLQAAAEAGVFAAGTHQYIDHPTESERYERPERTLRDLAAVLASDAVWNGEALVAETMVFGGWRDALDEMREAIGVSIRALAETTQGEAEGQRGTIVTELVAAESVDFVTRAGRGGRIVSVIESARPGRVVDRAILKGVAEATANELREQLQNALREAYGGEKSWVWVRDFDETFVWYEHETPDESGTYQHGYEAADDGGVSLTGQPVEVRPQIKYVPVTPAGDQSTDESQGGTMPNIEESELARLREADGRVSTLESERNQAQQTRDQALRELAVERARGTAATRARARVAEANADLPAAAVDRIVAEATRDVPVVADGERAGQLDEAALDARVDEARTREETYIAQLAERSGAGTVSGFGGGAAPEAVEARKITDQAIAEAFGRKPAEAGKGA